MSNCNCQNTIIHKELVDECRNAIKSDEILSDMADFFKIFGDSTRLKIINTLMSSRMCVCDIASVLNMTHSAISHQLAFLKEHNIVKFEKAGKSVYYSLDDNHIKKIFDDGWEHINEKI